MRAAQKGFSLLEVVVASAVLGVFLLALVAMEGEMRAWERRLPVNFTKHPQISAVMSRLRRDVLDLHVDPAQSKFDLYAESHDGFTASSSTLIVRSWTESGLQTIVWDFSKPGEVLRRSYQVGVSSDWVARGLPPGFQIGVDAVLFPGRPWGVRIVATDGKGNIAIDQILQPRAHY